MGSSDLEDVIAVLDGRPEIIDEIRDAPHEVKRFLVKSFSALPEDDDFLDSLSGHLEFEGENPERVSIFLERIRVIASMQLSKWASSPPLEDLAEGQWQICHTAATAFSRRCVSPVTTIE